MPRRLREFKPVPYLHARANQVQRVEDFNKAKVMATQAAKSGAYLYPIKVYCFVEERAHQLMVPGYLLLPQPPHLVEASPLQVGTDNDFVSWCYCFHVRLCISPTTCCTGLRQRTPCRLHHNPPHAL